MLLQLEDRRDPAAGFEGNINNGGGKDAAATGRKWW